METKTPMTEEEYQKSLKAIEEEYQQKLHSLYHSFARSNAKYSIGDIIGCDSYTIKVERIKTCKDYGLPYVVYIGVELKKDLTPKKNMSQSSLFDARARLIKKAE